MTPEEFMDFVYANQDTKYRDFHTRIANTPLEVNGVRVPILKKLAKEICKEDWRSFTNQDTLCFEHCLVKAVVIATAKMDGDERMELTRSFVPEIVDWAVCDTFCGSWKLPAKDIKLHEKLWDFCLEYLETGEEFPMRVGAVMMMDKFIDDNHIDDMLRLLTMERASPGYYWDMGCAWALSFCYIRYPEKTEKAIFSGTLSDVILGMTVGKVRDSFRVSKETKDSLKRRLKEFRESKDV